MNKRIFAFIILVVLTAATLSACSKSNGSSNSESTGNTENKGYIVTGNGDLTVGFTKPSGFYDEPVELEFTCGVADAQIYYTLDGSEPENTDTLYTEPLTLYDRSAEENLLSAQSGVSADGDYFPKGKVDKAHVIRAAAYLPDGTKGGISSATYWVGIDRQQKYGDVPVISIFTDSENLFDYEKGIYVLGKTHDEWLEAGGSKDIEGWRQVGNYSNKGREWERPVTVEYIEPDGNVGFVQNMGFRIMGGASRNSMQKSLRFTARKEYGEKSVQYELIPSNEKSDGSGVVEKYKSFILRNGGNDADYCKIRDPLFQSLVSDRRFETMQFTPVVAFLDGEYWGMYTLAEDYNDNYVENNFGVDNNNVVVVKNGKIEDGNDGDIELYNEMYDYITKNDMSIDANYQKACELLDMGSYMDYCAFNLYILNEDSIFDNNNWEMFRVRNADGNSSVSDGKWRMMVYDTDFSAGIYSQGRNFNTNNITERVSGAVRSDEERKPADLLISLCKNEQFKKEFVLAMCDTRNVNFEVSHALTEKNKLVAVYEALVPDTFRRFGPSWVADYSPETHYAQKISELSQFISGRYRAFPALVKSAFSLSDSVNVNVKSSDSSKGSVTLNTALLDLSKDFNGAYFTEYDITLKAVAADGAKFVKWEYSGCTVSNENAAEITVGLNGDCTITAVFE